MKKKQKKKKKPVKTQKKKSMPEIRKPAAALKGKPETDEKEQEEELPPAVAVPGETDEPEEEKEETEIKGSGVKESLYMYFDEIRGQKVLTEKEEKEIIRKAKRGDVKAREVLIKANLKLVVKMAKKYEYLGVPLVDLIEEGNIGLMKALEKFLPAKGFRFSTYATWWIRQSVNRAIANQKNTIRIPVHILDIYHKYLKLVEKSLKKNGEFPDRLEAAKKLGIEDTKLNEILNIIKSPKSLDLEYESEDSDSSRSLKDTIEDTSFIKADDDFMEKDRKEKLLDLVDSLKPNEREVIMYRFGINDRKILTLEEIGKRLKLTRERIRQIEMMAIKKLKFLVKTKDTI